MGFEYMPDGNTMFGSGLQIQFHIALWVNDDRFTLRCQKIRGVREAPQIELFKVHGDHPSNRPQMLDEISCRYYQQLRSEWIRPEGA